jgi:hypothetical protein
MIIAFITIGMLSCVAMLARFAVRLSTRHHPAIHIN